MRWRKTDIIKRRADGPFEPRPRTSKIKDLNITSLIDILTILLVFMLKNISMDAVVKSAPEGMLLPTTITKDELVQSGLAINVKIYTDKILYGTDNIRVGSLDEFINKEEVRKSLLALLKLEAQRIIEDGNVPSLLIQADRELDCRYITEFINFSASASFANIYFSTIHTDNLKEVLGV
ncbi:MAG: biopolymer transporter ExbD [Candidatus Cloacimonetes bacterium]|nr:biopolymer transporter ExbD [Candidatus Cloacimonadota bacterium]